MGLCRSVKRDKRGHPVNRIPENLCFCISMYRSAAANAGIALFIPIRWPVRAMKWPCIFQRCMPSWDNGGGVSAECPWRAFSSAAARQACLIRINWRACWIVRDGRLKCCPERKSAWKPTRIPCIRRKRQAGSWRRASTGFRSACSRCMTGCWRRSDGCTGRMRRGRRSGPYGKRAAPI